MNIFLPIMGLAILVFGVYKVFKNVKLAKHGIKMEAEIIEVRKKVDYGTDSDGYSSKTDMYYPVYKYTYEGKEYSKESNIGVSNSRKYKVGGMINIIFTKEKPESAEVRTVFNLWILPIIFILVGAMLVVLGFTVK